MIELHPMLKRIVNESEKYLTFQMLFCSYQYSLLNLKFVIMTSKIHEILRKYHHVLNVNRILHESKGKWKTLKCNNPVC